MAESKLRLEGGVGLTDRELLARLIQCEAGGEGETGMRAVASVIMNRVRSTEGEFSRVSDGGSVRNIITQPGQFNCMAGVLGGAYNPQNVYNMSPEPIHYDIADWALAGNILSGVDEALFFHNPYSDTCPAYFPTRVGVIHNRIGDHCFYIPTKLYSET